MGSLLQIDNPLVTAAGTLSCQRAFDPSLLPRPHELRLQGGVRTSIPGALISFFSAPIIFAQL